ncbi:unnamed protein product, partial [Mesorhabditis spiculigera]
MDVVRSKGQRMFLHQAIEHGIRIDGRGSFDHRPLSLEQGILRTADGSARVILGKTELFVIINAEMLEVDDSSSLEKRLNFTVKIAPQGPNAARFGPDEKRRDDEDLERDEILQLSVGIRPEQENSSVIMPPSDNVLDKLAVKYEREISEENECLVSRDIEAALDKIFNDLSELELERIAVSKNHVWSIEVELMVVKYAGNLLEAAYLGAKAALDDFVCIQPPVTHDTETGKDLIGAVQDEDALVSWKFDIEKTPLIGTSYRVGDSVFLDPNDYEEVLNPVLCWVAIDRPTSNKIADDDCCISWSALTGTGGTRDGIHREMLTTAIRSARKWDPVLRDYIKLWRQTKRDPYATVLLSFNK